jgi:hypothetical protein
MVFPTGAEGDGLTGVGVCHVQIVPVLVDAQDTFFHAALHAEDLLDLSHRQALIASRLRARRLTGGRSVSGPATGTSGQNQYSDKRHGRGPR